MSERTRARLPYARQSISDADIAAVVAVLKSDWLTTGPAVDEFESAFAGVCGSAEAVAVANGTAALHAAAAAAGFGPGDEVIVPCLTFAATANAVVYRGATPVFVDVDPGTLLLDPEQVERAVTPRTRAIIAVDFAGQPCDYDALQALVRRRGLVLIADAAHALGARVGGRPVGSVADLSAFSFHPVKHITTGEGGMVTTDVPEWAARLRRFRNHGIANDARERERLGSFSYDMVELGFNYRLSDLQCALGLSQLRRLDEFLRRRRALAALYHDRLRALSGITPLGCRRDVEHAYHLFVVRIDPEQRDRATIYRRCTSEGVQVNVHYRPVHLHTFYRQHLGTGPGLCPHAERAYEQLLSLPLFPAMTDRDVDRVVETLADAMRRG